VKKDFANKKGSVGLGLENFLTPTFKIRSDLSSRTETLDTDGILRTSVIEQRGLTEFHNLSVRLNISYRIGKMSTDGPRPRRGRSINNDDLKDAGDNGGGMEGGGGQGGGQQRGGFGGGQQGNGGGMRPAATGAAVAPKTPAGDPAAVVNAAGSWAYTLESPQGGEGTLTIKKDGETYSGTITNKRFNSNTTLSSVAVKGNELTFAYEVTGQGGNTMAIQVTAIITGDTLNGNMTVGQFGTFPIKAKRE